MPCFGYFYIFILSVSAVGLTFGQNNVEVCSLYIAPSIISNASLGLYSTRSYEQGVLLDTVPVDISIPFAVQTHFQDNSMLANYYWDDTLSAHPFSPHKKSHLSFSDLLTGFGSIPNHDSFHQNIRHGDDRRALTDQYSRPHAGTDAYTPFHHATLETLAKVEAGSELFLDYGESYFITRSGFYQKAV